MIVDFDKSFSKSLLKIKDQSTLNRVKKVIMLFEAAENVESLTNIKKLTGFSSYFRVKVGDYRLGFEKLDTDHIRMIIIAHRKDIYKHFP